MESAREILGGQKMAIIEGLYEDLRHAQKIIDDLLCLTGRPSICFSCARPILRIEPADKNLTERATLDESTEEGERAGFDEGTVRSERSVNEGSPNAPLIHVFNYNGEPHRCTFSVEVAHE